MIVRDAKLTQPLVNIETLPLGSYILHNGLVGVVLPYRPNGNKELSYAIYILHETMMLSRNDQIYSICDELSNNVENLLAVLDIIDPASHYVSKGTKVLPVKITKIEYEVVETK